MKYKVPEGMLIAAGKNWRVVYGHGSHHGELQTVLEPALRWLDRELEEMDKDEPFDRDLQIRRVRDLWTAPEPEIPEFIECDACRAKPGSPYLCAGCLHNRQVIEALRQKVKTDA